ncbi:unnamed protein product [Durusdinium trenchii]|uniref:EF-hand domain-containing protein n=1 Tax=Durusdinium trenchii TaxID=1381693 RepID=A0ABP0MLD7_9DINO
MLAGVPPFHDDDDLELMKKVKRGKWSFTPEKAWKRVSAVGKELGASDCPSLLGVAWCRGIAGELKNYPWPASTWSFVKAVPAFFQQLSPQTRLVTQMLTKDVDSRPHSAEVAQSRLKKVALQVIARQISDDTIEKLREIFLSLDDDNSGTLSAGNLTRWFDSNAEIRKRQLNFWEIEHMAMHDKNRHWPRRLKEHPHLCWERQHMALHDKDPPQRRPLSQRPKIDKLSAVRELLLRWCHVLRKQEQLAEKERLKFLRQRKKDQNERRRQNVLKRLRRATGSALEEGNSPQKEDVEEIDEALIDLQVEEPIRVEMRRLMHEIDVDGSGTVNYTELALELSPEATATEAKQQLAEVLQCEATALSLVLGTSTWDDGKAKERGLRVLEATDVLSEGAEITVIKSEGWVVPRIEALKAKFEKFGKLLTEPGKHELSHDAELPEGLEFPASLALLLKYAVKWSYRTDMGIPPLELFVANQDFKLDIFGDEECKADWMEEHGEESCAGDDWMLLASSSEYDYFFVNVKKSSPHFGMVKCGEQTSNVFVVFCETKIF